MPQPAHCEELACSCPHFGHFILGKPGKGAAQMRVMRVAFPCPRATRARVTESENIAAPARRQRARLPAQYGAGDARVTPAFSAQTHSASRKASKRGRS